MSGVETGWAYTVALPTRIVQVLEQALAPEYEPGERVRYHGPDGVVAASIVKTDAAHWYAVHPASAAAARVFRLRFLFAQKRWGCERSVHRFFDAPTQASDLCHHTG